MLGWAVRITSVAGVALLAACSPAPAEPTATTPPAPQQADRDRLAGLAAAAKDRRYVATYRFSAPNRPDRTVTVALGADGSWVVAVPAGALSGLADVAVYSSAAGLFQCSLGAASGTAGSRPDLGPLNPGCTQVSSLTATTDPRVQHLFTDWIDPLVDRATALSVASVPVLEGAQGACFSVESNSAALAPPVDPGVYCYQPDGVLSAARVGFGTLVLAGPVAPAPGSVTMPAPLVGGEPLPMTAPPPPPPPPSPTPSPGGLGGGRTGGARPAVRHVAAHVVGRWRPPGRSGPQSRRTLRPPCGRRSSFCAAAGPRRPAPRRGVDVR